jgi:hypothetical protein
VKLSVAILLVALGGCTGGATAPRFDRDWVEHPAVVTITGATEMDAVGDLHGDLEVTYHLLSSAGIMTMTAPPHWAAGTRVVVVTGDVIDKGSRALPIIDLLMQLEPEARAAGGRLVTTLGNHEADFISDPTGPKSIEFQMELRAAGLDPVKVAAGDTAYGAWLRNLPVAALVDDWFLCHSGDSEGRSVAWIAEKFREVVDGPSGYDHEYLIGMGSILSANTWWQNGPSEVATLDAYLAALPAKHVVLGHDPGAIEFSLDPKGTRKAGELAVRLDGRLFLIDVGMSHAVGESAGALLRITRDAASGTATATTIFVDGAAVPLWP